MASNLLQRTKINLRDTIVTEIETSRDSCDIEIVTVIITQYY